MYFTGYIADVRILKGTALYSGATYVVPTAPLTAITNTSLLLNYTNAGIYDNAAVGDYETVGNAQVSTAVKKYGTGSMSFDGAGDYIVAAQTQPLAPGTGDFCYELWLYLNSTAAACVFDTRTVNNNTTGFTLLVNGSAQLALYTNTTILTCSATLAATTWYHIAVTRTAGNIKVFLNGTQIGTLANTSNFSDKSFRVGQYVDGTGSLNGYVDDIRVTNGVSRYPYNFTPPTAAFPNIGGTVTLTADPYYNYTTLLLPGNGTNGAQNNTFLDSSSNAFTITRNGNTTQGNFSPFSQTGWGNYFNGSTDYLTAATNAAFAVPAEYTVEFWAYQVASPTNYASYFLVNVSNGLQIGFNTGGGGVFGVANNLIGWQLTTTAFPLNQWTHIAITRDTSNVTRIFYNGTLQTSGTIATSYAQGELRIGNSGANNGYINGYVSNMRYLKGTALYTANFTPPTVPLTAITNTQLLTAQSNRFVDNSTNAFALTVTGSPSVQAFSPFAPTAAWSASTNGGSGYFDGSGDYLTVASNSVFNIFNQTNATVEFWFNPSAYSVDQDAICYYVDGNNFWMVQFAGGQANKPIKFYTLNAGVTVTLDVNQSSTTFLPNQWNHCAFVKSGSTWSSFINGSRVATAGTAPTINFTGTLYIGSRNTTVNPITGYLSGLRITNTVEYSGTTYTVPTAPPTAISGTGFLANYTNGGIVDATAKNDLETISTAQISTAQSKFGGSSMLFNGSSSLSIANNSIIGLGGYAGDFTIEMWAYPTSGGSGNVSRLYFQGIAAGYCPITIAQSAASYAAVIYASSTGSTWNLASAVTIGTMNANAWNHIAVCRYGTNIYCFMNGILGSTTAVSTTALMATSANTYIGSGADYGGTFYTGYIDDLRITKGIARYTSNFTPPTSAFLLQ